MQSEGSSRRKGAESDLLASLTGDRGGATSRGQAPTPPTHPGQGRKQREKHQAQARPAKGATIITLVDT